MSVLSVWRDEGSSETVLRHSRPRSPLFVNAFGGGGGRKNTVIVDSLLKSCMIGKVTDACNVTRQTPKPILL